MGCLYDENFKLNEELLKYLETLNIKKILVISVGNQIARAIWAIDNHGSYDNLKSRKPIN